MEIEKASDELIKALEESEQLKTWSNEEFGKTVTFIMGKDQQDPTPKEDCPCVSLYGATTQGYEEPHITFYFGFAVIGNEAPEWDEIKKIRKRKGFFLAERFRELCQEIIRKAKIAGIFVGSESVPEVNFPIWESMSKMTLRYPFDGRN